MDSLVGFPREPLEFPTPSTGCQKSPLMISLENGPQSPAIFSVLPLDASLKEHQYLRA